MEVPVKEQCEYCKKKQEGKCYGRDEGCLYFEENPKGRIRTDTVRLEVILGTEIPPLRKWVDGWKIGEENSEIRLNEILGLEWNMAAGKLIILSIVSWWEQKYKSAGEEKQRKFKVITGGK